MTTQEAINLIQDGVPEEGGVWADLGAGSGTFTQALNVLLGQSGAIYAVDTNNRVQNIYIDQAKLYTLQANFSKPLDLPKLDGILMANSLHYIRKQEKVLNQLIGLLKPGGTFLLIEYDMNRASPWVPFPIPPTKFERLAMTCGLSKPVEIGRKPSLYGPRDIYAVAAEKPA